MGSSARGAGSRASTASSRCPRSWPAASRVSGTSRGRTTKQGAPKPMGRGCSANDVMLLIPPRAELRAHPIETERLLLLPIDPSDGPELWLAVSGSRAFLQRWLPWVQFHTDPSASVRFAEACASDWDQGRALRFVIRERAHRTLAGVVGLESCVHLHRSCELGDWLR